MLFMMERRANYPDLNEMSMKQFEKFQSAIKLIK